MKNKNLVYLLVGDLILFVVACQAVLAQQTLNCPAPGPSVCFCDDFEYASPTPASLEQLTACGSGKGDNFWYSSPAERNYPAASVWATKPAGGMGVAHEIPCAENYLNGFRQSCSSTTKLVTLTLPTTGTLTYRFTAAQRVNDWPNLLWITNWLILIDVSIPSVNDPVVIYEIVNTVNTGDDKDSNPAIRLSYRRADASTVQDCFRINPKEVGNYLWFHQRTIINVNNSTVTLTGELRGADGTQVRSILGTSLVCPSTADRTTLTVGPLSGADYARFVNTVNNKTVNIRIYPVVVGKTTAVRATEIKKVEVIKE